MYRLQESQEPVFSAFLLDDSYQVHFQKILMGIDEVSIFIRFFDNIRPFIIILIF